MDWEFSILYFLQGLHQPWLDKLMVAITTLGEEGIIWIVLALAMLCTKKYRTCGIGVAISLVLMLFIVISMAIIAKYDKDGEGTAF